LQSLSLDEDQREVVDYPDSSICIAGPGSGKTRVLVAKAEALYSKGEDLICLTFTRSAVKEMRDRMSGLPVQTIHSFCHGEVGWTGDYDQMLDNFQQLKNKPRYKWVLIDEVQDLTKSQLDVALSIVGDKIFAVGDPYQSIYGFNGALGILSIEGLRNFGCTEFLLKNNYRSCPEIVDLLNGIYSRDLVSTGLKETGLTAILTRTNKDLSEIEEALSNEDIGYTLTRGSGDSGQRIVKDYGSDKLHLMTCHCSKGLEFDWVILYKWFPDSRSEKEFIPGLAHSVVRLGLPVKREQRYSQEEQNLYYVTVARASRGFYYARSLDLILKALRVTEYDRIKRAMEVTQDD